VGDCGFEWREQRKLSAVGRRRAVDIILPFTPRKPPNILAAENCDDLE
jgi:hypothetical protein